MSFMSKDIGNKASITNCLSNVEQLAHITTPAVVKKLLNFTDQQIA